ncbi:hypothetical protein AcW1_009183 [Taiwanofungus camphoratus]|nr:hypothetical protein AcW1_009183 [Antrodia cinnamomea]
MQAARDHRADAHPVSGLDPGDLVAHAGDLSDDLVPDDEWEVCLAPALRERVDVGPADTAVGDRDFNVLGLKVLWLDGEELEVTPFGGVYEPLVGQYPHCTNYLHSPVRA